MQINIDSSVEKFIQDLDNIVIAKTLRTIDLLEKFGNQLGMPHSKKVTKEFFELRVRGKQEIRIFYCFKKNTIYLIHGFVKKTQKTPAKELQHAKNKFDQLTQYNHID